MCNEYFIDIYVNKDSLWLRDVVENNLIANIDTILSKSIWIAELAIKEWLDISTTYHWLETTYNNYIEEWFKWLIVNEYYYYTNDRVFTKNKIQENIERINEMVMKLK